MYKSRRRSLLAEVVLASRQVPDEYLEQVCKREAESYHKVWLEEHRTLGAFERLARILGELSVSLPEAAFAELVTRYEEEILERPPIPVKGAREVLEVLSHRYRLGIISDVGFSPGRVLKKVLDNNNVLGLFDTLIFSDETGRSKPHLEVFQLAARLLAVEPESIVHVGDLERTDIIGAKSAGFRAIRFTGVTPMDKLEESIADFVTDDLTDLPRLVGMLGS